MTRLIRTESRWTSLWENYPTQVPDRGLIISYLDSSLGMFQSHDHRNLAYLLLALTLDSDLGVE